VPVAAPRSGLAGDSTFGDLQNRIADELGGRADLLTPSSGLNSSPIQLAIYDAISQWQNERFWFNEYRTANAFTTKLGQEFYDASDWPDIASIHQIDKLSVLISGNRYYMTPRTEQYMEDLSINPAWSGQPKDYSYYNFQLRFYPIPNGVYPVNVLGTKDFGDLIADDDSNVWTTTAEPLIRANAKLYLYRDTLQDDDRAQAMAQAMNFEERNLRGGTQRRVPTTRLSPTSW
jgi:hypothetical protein